jgi:hypothetical protein
MVHNKVIVVVLGDFDFSISGGVAKRELSVAVLAYIAKWSLFWTVAKNVFVISEFLL